MVRALAGFLACLSAAGMVGFVWAYVDGTEAQAVVAAAVMFFAGLGAMVMLVAHLDRP